MAVSYRIEISILCFENNLEKQSTTVVEDVMKDNNPNIAE